MEKRKFKKYRITLIDDETHERIHSVKVTKPAFYGVAALSLAVVIGFCYSLLVLTPLRQTIPGYPDAHFRRDAISNAIRIDSLESAITRWEIYSESLMRVLTGEQNFDIDELLSSGAAKYLAEENEAILRERDSLLRDKVAREEAYSLSSGSQKHVPIEGVHFFTPLKGVVSNGYNRGLHPAVDITAPAGSVVKSVLDGTVIYAGWSDEFGYTITVQHSGDIVTSYKHNNSLLRKAGDKIKAGTPIAYVGNTGRLSSGDHLHFELWYKGEALDPEQYISF